MSSPSQILHSLVSKFFNYALAVRGKFHTNNSVICTAMRTPEQFHSREAINALDGRVVPHQKTRREPLDGGGASLRHAANGEQELKLLGFQPGGPRSFIAIGHEKADLITEFRERTIVTLFRS